MIIMKRLIIGIVVCLLIASCIVILPITSTVANRLGETDGILTCSVTKKQSSQTTSPVIWDKETFAAFYSLAQTVNATFHGADPHMEYPLEETSYTLYLEHPQGESDLLVLTEGNLLFYHGLRYTLDSNVEILEKIEDNKAVLSRTYDSFLAARNAVQQIDVETGNYIALLS